MSKQAETRHSKPTSKQPEVEEGKQTSKQPETREGKQTSKQPETRKGKQTSKQPETRKGKQMSKQPETREGNQASKQPETREGKETSKQPETREGKQTSKQPETREGKQTLTQGGERAKYELPQVDGLQSPKRPRGWLPSTRGSERSPNTKIRQVEKQEELQKGKTSHKSGGRVLESTEKKTVTESGDKSLQDNTSSVKAKQEKTNKVLPTPSCVEFSPLRKRKARYQGCYIENVLVMSNTESESSELRPKRKARYQGPYTENVLSMTAGMNNQMESLGVCSVKSVNQTSSQCVETGRQRKTGQVAVHSGAMENHTVHVTETDTQAEESCRGKSEAQNSKKIKLDENPARSQEEEDTEHWGTSPKQEPCRNKTTTREDRRGSTRALPELSVMEAAASTPTQTTTGSRVQWSPWQIKTPPPRSQMKSPCLILAPLERAGILRKPGKTLCTVSSPARKPVGTSLMSPSKRVHFSDTGVSPEGTPAVHDGSLSPVLERIVSSPIVVASEPKRRARSCRRRLGTGRSRESSTESRDTPCEGSQAWIETPDIVPLSHIVNKPGKACVTGRETVPPHTPQAQCHPAMASSLSSSQRSSGSRRHRLAEKWTIASERSMSNLFQSELDKNNDFSGFRESHDASQDLPTDMSYEEVSEVELQDRSGEEWLIEDAVVIDDNPLDVDNGAVVPASDCSSENENNAVSPIKIPKIEHLLRSPLKMLRPAGAAVEVLSPIKLPFLDQLTFSSPMKRSEGSEWDDNVASCIQQVCSEHSSLHPVSRLGLDSSALHAHCDETRKRSPARRGGRHASPAKRNPMEPLDSFLNGEVGQGLWDNPMDMMKSTETRSLSNRRNKVANPVKSSQIARSGPRHSTPFRLAFNTSNKQHSDTSDMSDIIPATAVASSQHAQKTQSQRPSETEKAGVDSRPVPELPGATGQDDPEIQLNFPDPQKPKSPRTPRSILKAMRALTKDQSKEQQPRARRSLALSPGPQEKEPRRSSTTPGENPIEGKTDKTSVTATVCLKQKLNSGKLPGANSGQQSISEHRQRWSVQGHSTHRDPVDSVQAGEFAHRRSPRKNLTNRILNSPGGSVCHRKASSDAAAAAADSSQNDLHKVPKITPNSKLKLLHKDALKKRMQSKTPGPDSPSTSVSHSPQGATLGRRKIPASSPNPQNHVVPKITPNTKQRLLQAKADSPAKSPSNPRSKKVKLKRRHPRSPAGRHHQSNSVNQNSQSTTDSNHGNSGTTSPRKPKVAEADKPVWTSPRKRPSINKPSQKS